jgi:acetyl-CoA carboxylase alpha subunit
MSAVSKFMKKYPPKKNTLEEKLQEIEKMDVSAIKKIDLIQEAKESERPVYTHNNSLFDDEYDLFGSDNFYNQMIIEYGIFHK